MCDAIRELLGICGTCLITLRTARERGQHEPLNCNLFQRRPKEMSIAADNGKMSWNNHTIAVKSLDPPTRTRVFFCVTAFQNNSGPQNHLL